MKRLFLVLLVALLCSATTLAAPPVRQSPPAPAVPAGLQAAIHQVKPAVALVEVNTPDGMAWGTGFVVSSDGHLVTNAHVVADAQRVSVYLKNTQKTEARIVATQETDDLVLPPTLCGRTRATFRGRPRRA